MFRFFPNFWPFLGFGARTAGIQPAALPCATQNNKDQLMAAQAVNKSKADSSAFVRLSAEFRLLSGSDSNAQNLVTGLRDGTGITLTYFTHGSASSASFTPPTGRMGYSNVSIALSLARQHLVGQGVGLPTPHQLQAALVGGKITSPITGNTLKLPGILQLKVEGLGWGKIASLLGIKLGSVISGAKPVILQPRINAYTSLVKRTHTAQLQGSMTKAATALSTDQHVSIEPGQASR